ncbi:MAG: hypothetical protein Q4G70_01380 [Pseudomonadota bacterium]|nr:hypothetical protein [Pseudomonadota bacterium]
MPKGSTRADVARVLKDAGALSNKQKVFGLGERAGEVMFSRSPATKTAYEARIDALFAGGKPALDGVRVLDRSDVLGLLGMGDGPVHLAVGKVRTSKHPNMTAEVWKKIPEWLDNPAAVFDSDTVAGRLVAIAPEDVGGQPVLMVIEPNGQRRSDGMRVHLLQNAYDKDEGAPPFDKWFREGKARYVNQKEFPAVLRASGLQLSGTAWQNKPGTPKILTEKNLAGWRRANNPAFSFAGERAATANQHALATARERINAGEDAETVRQDTGWHIGADGRWRFEISDHDASLKLSVDEFRAFARGDQTVMLGDLLEHPALFAAYPHLAETPVGTKAGRGASYSQRTGRILMGGSVRAGQFQSILLHEIQHDIQTVEGFANGGAVSQFKGDLAAQRDQYRRQAGEVEARNTQTREHLTPEQRRAFTPQSTQDVAESDVIVTFNGKDAADAPAPANAEMALTPELARRTARIQKAVDAIHAKWTNAPETVVVADMRDARIPRAVRAADAQQKSQGATGEPEGFFYGGKVYLVASQLNDAQATARVLAHESLGHHGLRGVFGDRLTPILNRVALAKRAEVIAKAREYGLVGEDVDVDTATDSEVWRSMTPEQRQQAAEEVLAVLAQEQPNLPLVRQAIAVIRAWLREHIPGFNNLRVTDDEIIQQYILPARGWVQRGQTRQTAAHSVAAAYSRAGKSQFEAEVDAAIAAGLKDDKQTLRQQVSLGARTPAVLRALGVDDKPLYTNRDLLAKMHIDHGVPRNQVKDLADLLANPAMVFASDTQPGRFTVVTSVVASGKPVVVAVEPNGASQGLDVVYLPSAYPKNNADRAITGWIRSGLLRYADKGRSRGLATNAGLQLPGVVSRAIGFTPGKYKTEADVAQSAPESGASLLDKAVRPRRQASNFLQARAAAKAFQGKPLTNDATGMVATVSRNNLDKMLSTSAVAKSESPASHSLAVANLDALFKDAVLGWSKPDRDGDVNTLAVHRFFAVIMKDGRAQLAKLTVKETARADQPNPLYTVEAVEFNEKSPAVKWVDSTVRGDGLDPTSDPPGRGILSLAQQVEDFNRARQADQPGPAMFSRSASAMGTLTPAQQATWDKVAAHSQPQTWPQRLKGLRANMAVRLKTALVDQFAAIAEYDQGAYVKARMSRASDGALEAALLYGKPFLRDGVPDVDVKDGGFAKTLANLGGEVDRFMWWVAAQRASKLKSEGRENLFQHQDIENFLGLNAGKMDDGRSRALVFGQALSELNAFNDAMLKIAQQSGLMDEAALALFKDQPYVPFYRVMESGEMTGARFSSGLTNQRAWHKLQGGKDKLNADLLQNLMQNWSHVLAASARNRAALATMDVAAKMDVAYRVNADTKGAVKVMRDGVTEHWAIEDPHLLTAVSALHYVPSPLMAPLAGAKRLLTWGVTVNPTFKIRNLIRDSVSAIAQTELGYNPASNVAGAWKLTAADSQIYASMLASGGVIKFGTMENTQRLRDQVKRLGGEVLDEGGWKKLSGQMRALYDAYQEVGDRMENVNRVALYEQLRKKGHDHAEASFMARGLMDFSMSGAHPVVRFLVQSVPFLNARMQGLYKLGRAAGENPARFAAVTGAVAMASLALLALFGDDEDWKKREDWDRDAYWWFKIGDKAFRIPKPFEVGAIGTLAERTAEWMFSKEMTNRRMMERLGHMLAQTFAFDPVPQAFKPLLDVYANKDSFTGRAIEGMGDERLRPQDRYNERTSEVARLLGQLGLPNPAQLVQGDWQALSPKQIDHLLRGYFSWVGTTGTAALDLAARPMLGRGDRPAMQLRDTFVVGNFVESLPTGSSRYVTVMYEQAREAQQAWASYQAALQAGDTQGAARIMTSDGDKLRQRLRLAHATRRLSELNAQAKRVQASASMDGAAKRERLDEIGRLRHEVAKGALGV